MDDVDLTKLSQRAYRYLDPLHSLIYFVPEAEERYVAIGLRPGRMHYFASRSAAFGAVGPGAVAATFYNFNPETVSRAIPRAWSLATPEAVLAARLDVADASLRRLLGAETISSAEVAELAEIAREAATGLPAQGRALYAAHADLPWPEVPHLVLWHAITLLREWRGDAHVALLLGSGLSGIEALVSHTATGRGFTPAAAKATRGWGEEDWEAAALRLRDRGLLGGDGLLTEDGRALRAGIEARTDELSIEPWARLGAVATARAGELGKPLTMTAAANGAFPPAVFGAS